MLTRQNKMLSKQISRLCCALATLLLTLLVTACERESTIQVTAVLGPEINPQIAPARPNILLIVADDMGYSDLGAFGGEIATPNLDVLAFDGLRLTGFYTAAACAPTRAMLMTGREAHSVGVGGVEFRMPAQRDQPGYRLVLDAGVPTLAELLGEAGYHTMMTGKWHLGSGEAEQPSARGFESSFALLEGGHNHYAKALFSPAHYRENGAPATWPEGAYSSDVFAGRMVDFLQANRGEDRPFFAYLSFTAPHWPLQAPAESIAKYEGQYDAGPEALREQRLARQVELGILASAATAHTMEKVPAWDSLSPEERAYESRKMEIHAAMVDHMDRQIGTVLSELRDSGKLDNTLVVFLSDNGAEGNFTDTADRWGFTALAEAMAAAGAPVPVFDNSTENLGNPNSMTSIGRGWAQALMAPYRRYKTFPTEGGIHAPAFISGPGVDADKVSGAVLTVADIVPTVLETAGIAWSRELDPRGRAVQSGRSWAPLLAGEVEEIYGENDAIGWEFYGGSALRRGDWKAVYVQAGDFGERIGYWGPGRWELFNLRSDPGETTDLARQQPALLEELVRAWHDYAAANDVVVLFPETQGLEAVRHSDL
jgi:arylsulfatase